MVCCSGKVKTDKPKKRLVRANKYFVMRIFISLIIRTICRNYFVKPENHFVKPKNDDVQGCFLRQKTPFKCIIKSDIFAPRASATWCFCGISLGVFAVMRQTTLNSPALITRGHYKDWEENQSAFPCWTGRPDRSNATPNKHSTTIQTMFNNRSNAFRTIHCPPPCINAGKTIRIGPGAFDKMSNEGLYRGNAYAKGRVSAQRKDSGAFRKIHIDSERGIFLLFG